MKWELNTRSSLMAIDEWHWAYTDYGEWVFVQFDGTFHRNINGKCVYITHWMQLIDLPDKLCHFCNQMVKYEDIFGTSDTCICEKCTNDYEGSQDICVKCHQIEVENP